MSTRITNRMMIDNFMSSHNRALSKMDRLQTQMGTGKRILRLSDDPVGVVNSMSARNKLYRLEQYKKNVDDAGMWLQAQETSILQINESIKRAMELGTSADGTKSPADKQAIAEEIKQMRDHVLSQLNETCSDKYVLAGYNSTVKPFTVDSVTGKLLYNGKDVETLANPDLSYEMNQKIEFEIGHMLNMDIATPGIRITGTGPDNLYKVFDDLYNSLMNNDDTTTIMGHVQRLQKKQSDVMAVDAEVGGKVNRLELMANRYATDILNYTEIKSKVEDIDEADAIMNFKMAEAVYQAALSVGAKIIQPTLTDFLR